MTAAEQESQLMSNLRLVRPPPPPPSLSLSLSLSFILFSQKSLRIARPSASLSAVYGHL